MFSVLSLISLLTRQGERGEQGEVGPVGPIGEPVSYSFIFTLAHEVKLFIKSAKLL